MRIKSQLEYERYKNEIIRTLNKYNNIQWGKKQNNKNDNLFNPFKIISLEELDKSLIKIKKKCEDMKLEYNEGYYIRRWLLIMIEECDIYIFSSFNNVKLNPNTYDKEYDLTIQDKLGRVCKLDLKGTRLPKIYRNNSDEAKNNIDKLIKYYYDNQSTERRYGYQNRLFVITIDEDNAENEMLLRSNFKVKENIFKMYCKEFNIDNLRKINVNNTLYLCGVILIIKKDNRYFYCKW